MPHLVDIPTRWGDMDAQAHINNAVFVDYLQEARVDFLHSGPFGYLLGDAEDPQHRDDAILVVSHELEYLAPVLHGQRLQIALRVESVGAARFVVAYDVLADGRPAARARTVLCAFDRGSQRIRRFTPEERAWFTERIETGEPLRDLPKPPEFVVGKAFSTPLTVRWSDIDSYQHVNNVRYFDYAQEIRLAMMRTLGATAPGQGVLWLLVRQDVHYQGQLRYRRRPYQGQVAVESIGSTSMRMLTRITDPDTGEVFAAARTVLVQADADGRPIPLSDQAREALADNLLG